jgi:hypothetical protein
MSDRKSIVLKDWIAPSIMVPLAIAILVLLAIVVTWD